MAESLIIHELVKNAEGQWHILTLSTCLKGPLCNPVLVNLGLCDQLDGTSCPVSPQPISGCRFLSTSLEPAQSVNLALCGQSKSQIGKNNLSASCDVTS